MKKCVDILDEKSIINNCPYEIGQKTTEINENEKCLKKALTALSGFDIITFAD